MEELPNLFGYYSYKEKVYQITALANINCRWEPTVVYKDVETGQVFARTAKEWNSKGYDPIDLT